MPLDRRVVRRLQLITPSAVMITEVIAGGPAERDGLMKGDVLLRLSGRAVSGVDDLHRLLIADLAGAEQSV